MKGLKYFAITGFLTLSAFAAVTYSSCKKDGCYGVTCLNGGSCSAGMCVCKDPIGFGGDNCEIEYRKLFSGTYQGYASNVGHNDTAVFKLDSLIDEYKSMSLTWEEAKVTPSLSFTIDLSNPSPNGVTFVIQKKTLGSRTYVGNGSISNKTLTVFLNETVVSPTDTVHNLLSFSNLIKTN